MRNYIWILFPLLGVLTACKSAPEAAATIKKYRTVVEARFAALKQIGAQLKAAPPLAKDGVTLDSGPLKLGADTPLATDNAILEMASRLTSDLSVDPGYGAGTKDLWWCAKLLGDKYYAERSSVSNAEAHLGHCANAKYLLAVRILESTAPKVDEGKGTFQAGSASGEVRVFNLGTSKDLGGFRFRARNTDLVTNRDGRGRDYTSVANDLHSQISSQVRAGFAKHLGGG